MSKGLASVLSALTVLVLSTQTGCDTETSEGEPSCTRDEDCPIGWYCYKGPAANDEPRCYSTPADAGASEGVAGTEGDADAEVEVSGDCSTVSCYTPDRAVCGDSTTIQVSSPVGYCELGECKYPHRNEACESGQCMAGACEENPCQGVKCSAPPASECNGGESLRVYEEQGRCAVNSGVAECRYASREIACDNGCDVNECIGNRCAGVSCNRPPARYCEDNELVVYNTIGVCSQGQCIYQNQSVECAAGCSGGTCIGTHPCQWVSCDVPPAGYCVGSELRVFESQGVCDESGYCVYSHQDIECKAGGCEQGQCTGDPCAGIVCDRPPANSCRGAELVTRNPVGFDGQHSHLRPVSSEAYVAYGRH